MVFAQRAALAASALSLVIGFSATSAEACFESACLKQDMPRNASTDPKAGALRSAITDPKKYIPTGYPDRDYGLGNSQGPCVRLPELSA